MSLQNYLPAKLYLHSDSNAPQGAKAANNFSTILKACLVTGFGDKPSAGWTLLFEDTAKNKKVFRSPALTERSFDVRVVDNGTTATVQVCFDMTSIDDIRNLKLQCATTFKYNPVNPTGRWTLIATSRGFWFFNEINHTNGDPPINQSGTYIFCGDTSGDATGRKALYLKHTGGVFADSNADRLHIFITDSTEGATPGKLYDYAANKVVNSDALANFDGTTDLTDVAAMSQVYVLANRKIWRLPAFSPTKNNKVNYDKLTIDNIELINHGTATALHVQNFYVPTNLWEL